MYCVLEKKLTIAEIFYKNIGKPIVLCHIKETGHS